LGGPRTKARLECNQALAGGVVHHCQIIDNLHAYVLYRWFTFRWNASFRVP